MVAMGAVATVAVATGAVAAEAVATEAETDLLTRGVNRGVSRGGGAVMMSEPVATAAVSAAAVVRFDDVPGLVQARFDDAPASVLEPAPVQAT